jgi:16S rRNA G966 N2-methylase RsmD
MNLSPETLAFIASHADEDVRALALQAARYPLVDMPTAVTQIAGRQMAARKLPSWYATPGLLYPRHLSMEQCSSQDTALYKASLVSDTADASQSTTTLADLTGGFGVDFSYMARPFRWAHYVERQEELCQIARHNFPLLGLTQAEVHHADGVEYLRTMAPVDVLFLDPARRDGHGGKTVQIADCEPDVAALEQLLVSKARRVLVKLSPMLDLSLALRTLHTVREAHVVAVGNECKELLLMLSANSAEPLPEAEVPITCAHFPTTGPATTFRFTPQQEHDTPCALAEEVGEWLYEPNPALLKAGAFKVLTARYPVQKLHPHSHLYTSHTEVADFPGRRFRVEAVTGFGKKELKQFSEGLQKANLTVRNFPLSVPELRKRLKWKEGGDDYVFATTLRDERKVLIRGRKF